MTTAQRGHEPRGVAAGRTVAIVGAGPGGLVAARYLKSEGFASVIVELGEGIGGQWYGEAHHSGVWPGMRTNTSRIMTSFSDLSHDERIPVYPTHQDMRMYLQRYAEKFDLVSCVRTRTRVEGIARAAAENGWVLRLRDEHGTEVTDVFPRVIVATGRHQRPIIPRVPGLSSFTGSGGIIHTFDYKHPERYRDLRVLVCGGSISALEIASDLAMLGATRVVSSSRRQRYVLQKLFAGVPTDHLAFTRFGALAEECMPPDVVANGLQDLIARTSGSPEHYGAPAPAGNVLEAGVTLSQHFLPLVAEGRIHCRPWPREVRGQAVRFADGHEERFDALIFGTGYEVSLPFLDPAIRRTLDADASHLDLHRFTFHPDLPGLAFLGLFELVGPYFPVLELQARWIAYTWSGTRPTPSPEDLRAGVAAYRSRRGGPQLVLMHAAAIMFAREVGAEPVLQQWPQLARPLLFGPLTPMSFRLSGPDHLPEASHRVVSDAMAFGAVPSMELTNEQRLQLQALATAKNDRRFAQYVQEMTAHERNAAPIRL